MEEYKYILFTAGRGPTECKLAVHGIQHQFKKYLSSKKLEYEVVTQKKGSTPKSLETILFKVQTIDQSILYPWIGTIQWICRSPIRKFHKRKNWFVKCEEVQLPNSIETDLRNVIVQPFRASGPGGQHRNKVETAIRLIHKASGIIVTASDSKSQSQNKKKAWHKLKEKVKSKNEQKLRGQNSDLWANQLEVERGSPIKTFLDINFKEQNG